MESKFKPFKKPGATRRVPGTPGERIAFIGQLPEKVSPGQRFRVENWVPYLEMQGYRVELFSFMDQATADILYKPGRIFQKTLGTLKGFARRTLLLFRLAGFDYVFLQREMAPLGPPFFEWFVAKVLRRKLIYDFDDAIWIPPYDNKLYSFIKCYWKVKWICRWAYRVSVGNEFLSRYALQYNSRVTLVPTVVDTERQHNRVKSHHPQQQPVIGWTGSHSTLPYLKLVEPVLQRLHSKVPFEFRVIADRRPDLNLPGFSFIPWNESTEIADLLQFDIGIMPLTADSWSEGKCGFKLIQYLALGIPSVASPVGVNKDIIVHGENGFLCNTDEAWENALEKLVSGHDLRRKMGQHGRERIEQFYSIKARKETFFSLFE